MRGTSPERMTAISRLAVEYAREQLARDRAEPRSTAPIDRIAVPPVRLALDTMSDRAAAQKIADAICRALARSIGP